MQFARRLPWHVNLKSNLATVEKLLLGKNRVTRYTKRFKAKINKVEECGSRTKESIHLWWATNMGVTGYSITLAALICLGEKKKKKRKKELFFYTSG